MIEIIDITKNPFQLIGKCTGVCWNAPVDDPERKKKRAISCVKANHAPVLEFSVQSLIDITFVVCMSWNFNHYVWW